MKEAESKFPNRRTGSVSGAISEVSLQQKMKPDTCTLTDGVKTTVIWEERKYAYPRRSDRWQSHSNNELSEVSRGHSSRGVAVKDRTERL